MREGAKASVLYLSLIVSLILIVFGPKDCGDEEVSLKMQYRQFILLGCIAASHEAAWYNR